MTKKPEMKAEKEIETHDYILRMGVNKYYKEKAYEKDIVTHQYLKEKTN